MKSISIQELEQWKQSEKDFVLIDVREDFEHDFFNIGGQNIPLGQLSQSLNQIPMDKDIVLYCAKGIRSVIALQKLESKGYLQLYNLSGGLAAGY